MPRLSGVAAVPPYFDALHPMLGVICAGQAVHAVYLTVMSSWPIWVWYFYHTEVLVLLVAPVLAGLILRLLIEPMFGQGPKFELVVCEKEIVFRHQDLRVWRFDPAHQ